MRVCFLLQAECEELGTRVDTLTMENMALRTEVNHLNEECTKLKAENTSLQVSSVSAL